jgi:serine/threonine protein kinase
MCIGSSLIDVFDDSPKRKVLGTPGWLAPESYHYLEASGLRKLDVYAFGLMVWRVMLNGVKPWQMLTKNANGEVRAVSDNESSNPKLELTYQEFDALKAIEHPDLVSDLASKTFEGCHHGDVDVDTVVKVLCQTLNRIPDLRVSDFKSIVSLLRNSEDNIT